MSTFRRSGGTHTFANVLYSFRFSPFHVRTAEFSAPDRPLSRRWTLSRILPAERPLPQVSRQIAERHGDKEKF